MALMHRIPPNNYWFGTHYNVNLYRGCNFGCIYCDSRSDCYHIDNFSQVILKPDIQNQIVKEMKQKRKKGVISLGAMSDSYNSFESKQKATRFFLECADRYGFGVQITTKSDLICRDIDLLRSISRHSPVCIAFTITAADDALAKQIEPYAPSSKRRFAALEMFRQQGIFSGITMMPLIPELNDTADNISAILQQAKKTGALFIHPFLGVTTRDGQREYFLAHLKELYPELADRLSRKFKKQYIWQRSAMTKHYRMIHSYGAAHDMHVSMPDIIHTYQAPYQEIQLSMF